MNRARGRWGSEVGGKSGEGVGGRDAGKGKGGCEGVTGRGVGGQQEDKAGTGEKV